MDEIKALPTSKVASILRSIQGGARKVADSDMPSVMRVGGSVVDALIGRSPEHFDDVASGMFTVKRPAQHESWVGANQPVVDALGITPTPAGGAEKAGILTAMMLKALGRGDEWRAAADIVRKTGHAPPGWAVHPGSDPKSPQVVKLEVPLASSIDPVSVQYLLDNATRAGIKSIPASAVFDRSPVVEAVNKLSPRDKQLTVRTGFGGGQFGKAIARMSHRDNSIDILPGLPDSALGSAEDKVGQVLTHELTHAGQFAGGLPDAMHGASPESWRLKGPPVPEPWTQKALPAGFLESDPVGAAGEIFNRQIKAAQAKAGPYKSYNLNPGEVMANATERMYQEAINFADKYGKEPSPAVRDQIARQIMARYQHSAKELPTFADIEDEMAANYKRFREMQRKKGRP